MPSYLSRPEGKLAFDDFPGTGRPVVCVPGMGDLRQSTRFIVPLLQQAGYRVITLDIRGHGESDTTFADVSAAAVGSDVAALLDHLDLRNAIIMGNSMAGGSAIVAAATRPERVGALVLTGPFVRDVPMNPIVGGILSFCLWRPWGVAFWGFFYKSLFKTKIPADLAEFSTKVTTNLHEPGRLETLRRMMFSSKAPCEARIPEVKGKPTVVVMGTKDPDFGKPAEEADFIAKAMGGSVRMVEGAGHYPHVEFPEIVLEVVKSMP